MLLTISNVIEIDSDFYSQPLLEALDKAVNIAKERRLDDTSRWGDVINEVAGLLPMEDMEKFKGFCDWGKYGLDESDGDLVGDLKRIFGTGEEDEGDDDSDNVRAEWFEEFEDQDACDGYRAGEMWKAYKNWLENRPEEMERFKNFMVRRYSFLFVCNAHEY